MIIVRSCSAGIRGSIVARLIVIFLTIDGAAGVLRAESDGWRPDVKTADQKSRQSVAAPQPSAPATGETKPKPADAPAPPASSIPEKKAPAGADQTEETAADRLPTEDAGPRESLAQRYCRVAVDALTAAKVREEAKKAELVKAQIEEKLSEMNAAISKLQDWLQRREDFKNKATENLVSVYAQMDAEAAAQRLVLVGEPTAAAILMKLPAKNASAVLGEMQPEMASKITAYMAGAAAVNTSSNVQAGAPR